MDEVLRDPTGYVVIGAEHPALGRVYWAYFDESEVNAPDYYGLTLDLNRASWAPVGWRTGEYLMGGRGETDLDTWQARRFLNTLLDEFRLDTEYYVDFDDDEMTEHLYGKLEQLRVQSGQSTQDFIAWIRAANWTDEPATN
ncbi:MULTISPECIES: hypothetical protein [Pseudomonas]|uniref:Uncharacterized protein n=1 Tax=Pseudomonas haemolytica TaxID=2600065 RepID=A0A646NZ54_9PSED|nr:MULTISPECIES: hypothetical protein [Pseudomonas]MBJ2236111.1 hypothetical protein [Pseudomonas fluorescens]MBH3369671.1 hypothetical protein [Pseudomonas carnis]MBJ2287453.1 hypothetical protein [Pseudomonas sp. MF6755]MBW9242798.1 hypothetical protein [Pseudomonas paracarnis]MRJ21996.1 hypothetical protein [Pseudomonas haemolytica]